MTAVCVMVVVDNCINLWTEPSLSVCMYGHFSLTVALYLALLSSHLCLPERTMKLLLLIL